MNKSRRQRIAKASSLVSEARSLLEEITGEEQDAFDNLPEGLQASERGEAMEEAISQLEEISASLEQAESELDDLSGGEASPPAKSSSEKPEGL